MKVYAVCAKKIKSPTWGSRLIMWFQKLSFSHICLLFEDEKPFVFESVLPRSRKILHSKWTEEYKSVEMYHIANIDENDIDIFIQCMDGIPYSRTQLVLIFLNTLIRSLFNRNGFITIDNGNVICTEVYTMFVRIFRDFSFPQKKDLVDLKAAYASMKSLEVRV